MATKPAREGVELHSDARERFERAVRVVAKSPPLHRTKKIRPKKPKLKRRRP